MTKKDVVELLQVNNIALQLSLEKTSFAERQPRHSISKMISANNSAILSLTSNGEIQE